MMSYFKKKGCTMPCGGSRLEKEGRKSPGIVLVCKQASLCNEIFFKNQTTLSFPPACFFCITWILGILRFCIIDGCCIAGNCLYCKSINHCRFVLVILP